jgi:periplasmic divalent cation tolerance protein
MGDDLPLKERDGAMTVVLTTVPDAATGEHLVRRLLEERLVACGNMVPGVISLFRWEGAVSREQELLVVLKTRAESVGALFARVEELHPYDVPELVEIPVAGVSEAYCRWVLDRTEGRA